MRLAAAFTRHAAAMKEAGPNRGKPVIHLQVRLFGKVYTVGRDALWKGRELGWFWTHHDGDGKEYHGRSLVLWMHQAGQGARRFEWECGRLSASF